MAHKQLLPGCKRIILKGGFEVDGIWYNSFAAAGTVIRNDMVAVADNTPYDERNNFPVEDEEGFITNPTWRGACEMLFCKCPISYGFFYHTEECA